MKTFLIAVIFSLPFIVNSQKKIVLNIPADNGTLLKSIHQLEIPLESVYKISDEKYKEIEAQSMSISNNATSLLNLKNYYFVEEQYLSDIEFYELLQKNKINYYPFENKLVKPPFDIVPTTPSFFNNQTYNESNPGVNIKAVWDLGYSGQNVKIHDVEYGFNKNHEEFNDTNCNIFTGMTVNTSASIEYTEHGTATMGVLYGQNSNYGVTGLAYGAQSVWLYPEWQQSGYSRVNAITETLNGSSVGDVIVLELQNYGNEPNNSYDFVPGETDPLVWNLTKTLTDSGRIVVAAAGNGNQNLDGTLYQSYMALGDSGAIIVGAGSNDTQHTKMQYSTYGSRVNVQAWGTKVLTSGSSFYNFTTINNDINQSYTYFSGTSSATAIVGGIVAVLQSYYYSQTNNWLTSLQLRNILQNTGISQGGDITKNIGPIPNVLAALNFIQQNLESKTFEKGSITLYPNPCNDILYCQKTLNQARYEIVDVLGKKIKSGTFTTEINVNDLKIGMYLLNIYENELKYTKKIIKN
jgi:subtilisin family serine protease